ncbi:hypothetical protein HDU96_009519 [Phlyctochytrium bullatum]|nr:hypothetical protein HDU96_009519 [Phlyctochytrium bullatum]
MEDPQCNPIQVQRREIASRRDTYGEDVNALSVSTVDRHKTGALKPVWILRGLNFVELSRTLSDTSDNFRSFMKPSRRTARRAGKAAHAEKRPAIISSPSFPNELLRTVLLYIEPLDLVALAAVNRHLRHAVPECIDQALAKYHIAQFPEHGFIWFVRVADEWTGETSDREIPFDHRMLFEHAIAAISRFKIGGDNTYAVWRKHWQFCKTDAKKEELRLHRVRVLRTAVQRRLWPFSSSSDDDRTPFDPVQIEDEIKQLLEAVRMAGLMRSFDLLDDLRRAFPEAFPDAIIDNLDSVFFKRFVFASAESGFCEGLSLIPQQHRILLETNSKGHYILGLTITSRHLPAVELLLAKGAPVNPGPTNLRSEPPLFHALEDGNHQILRLLLERGADVTRRSMFRESVLHRAITIHNHEALKLLLQFGADIETRDAEELTPLGFAAQFGQDECVRVLLDAGADVEALRNGDESVLYVACQDGYTSTVQLLIDRGASVNTPARSRRHSALFACVCRETLDNVEFTKILLEAGANVDWVNVEGMTALHVAMIARVTAPALLLLDAGADPNSKDDTGCTPLHLFPANITFTKEWEELLDRLIEKGADLQAKDASGETAWEALCATGLKNPGLLRWLLRLQGYGKKECNSFTRIWCEMFAGLPALL